VRINSRLFKDDSFAQNVSFSFAASILNDLPSIDFFSRRATMPPSRLHWGGFMKRMLFAVALAPLVFTSSAFAQARGGTTVVSPEVLPDKRVTFRVNAPKATDVTLTGDWLPPNSPAKLTKDDRGIWSVTLGPMEPGFMIYSFTVDGVAMADPINPRIKLRANTSASLVEVRGDGKQLWEIQDVPHGKVELNYIPSKVLNGQTREVRVYTPPGYDAAAATTYPIMYLLHGDNDMPAGWTDVGRANYIFDNLIAQKKAVPMIVVTPFGHAVPRGQPNNNPLFEKYLLEDVLPAVEKSYKIKAGRENRAIVGYSMGGGQALSIGLSHMDLFSAVGGFSPAVPGNIETTYAALWNDAADTNAKLQTLYIACGKGDSLFARSQQLDTFWKSKNINHTFTATEGYHNFINWRLHLGEVAPMLFQPKVK
jgi:enterochelin esterase-like enzyme